jgi:F0F1-type ATP synthase epsilon subunit
VLPERLTILADVAEHASEINQERAEESRKAIAERLAGQVHDDVERRSLEQELVMAEERLRLARIRRGGG